MKIRNEQSKTTKEYYIGHDDETTYFGKVNAPQRVWFDYDNGVTFNDWNGMDKNEREFLKHHGVKCKEYDERHFTQSFHATAEDALCYAALGVEANKTDERKQFLDNVDFDQNTGCYIWTEYFTRDGHTPNEKHLQKFKSGEYEMFTVVHELSILKTEQVKIA